MSYIEKTRLANKANYGGWRNTSAMEMYIVLHYTGNDGDSDEGNGNHFANNIVKASAHDFVDSDSVTHSVPYDYVAWAVGGNKYADCAQTGGGSLYGNCTNTNSISIELCDDTKDGSIYPSAATIANAIELTKKLMVQFNVPAERVIRHFDVTGKHCPDYWCGTAEKDELWFKEFHDKLLSGGENLNPVLREGATGTAVRRLQNRLNECGFTLDADGIFGPATLEAVKDFQERNGLEADGIVGPLTWAALMEEVSNMAKFSDTAGHWAEKTIDELAEIGIVHGNGEGLFEPNKPATKAEVAAMVRNVIRYITGK